jgi:hypothetical protein
MRCHRRVIIVALALTVPVLAGGVVALARAGVTIDWHIIAGGGGRVHSSSYIVDSTLGQPVAGGVAGEHHQVGSGYWGDLGPPASLPTPTQTATVTAPSYRLYVPLMRASSDQALADNRT